MKSVKCTVLITSDFTCIPTGDIFRTESDVYVIHCVQRVLTLSDSVSTDYAFY